MYLGLQFPRSSATNLEQAKGGRFEDPFTPFDLVSYTSLSDNCCDARGIWLGSILGDFGLGDGAPPNGADLDA